MANGEVDFFNDPDLEEGQEVEFDIEEAEKGPRATNLTRL
ncbi:hypothetical protein BRD07_05720 [Halobacteriales archaeon QS_9_68_42]|nr:MAG: hypothetical protein BRD07_05720 [Halobacteriales archaeon QS_9_68_42]